jgi:hypothetical protein
VEDLCNDIPRIFEFLSGFIARAVVDECLPPAFLARAGIMPDDMGHRIIQHAQQLLAKPLASARLAQVWGPGDGRSVPALKLAVQDMVEELLEGGDVAEAARIVKELNAPHFSHEVIKQLVTRSLARGERERELCAALLTALVSSEWALLTANQLAAGVGRVRERVSDLELDVPGAKVAFEDVIKRLNAKGVKL